MSRQEAKENQNSNGSPEPQAAAQTANNNIGVKIDYGTVDETWKEFGFREVGVNATNIQTGESFPTGTKFVLEMAENNQEFLRLAMPQSTAFVPHQAVEEIVTQLYDDLKVAEGNTKVEITKMETRESHYGNSRYWNIETNLNGKIHGSHIKDDIVGIGFSVRNGYNTGIALGVDPFSMRVVCENGAIGRGEDLGSATIKHVGNEPAQLLERLREAVQNSLLAGQNLIDFYSSLTKIKLNQKIAEQLYNKIWVADKYFPEYFGIIPKKEQKPNKPVLQITQEGRTSTLWETFNDITAPLWHSLNPKPFERKNPRTKKMETITPKGMNIYSVSRAEQELHTQLKYIMGNKGAYGAVAANGSAAA